MSAEIKDTVYYKRGRKFATDEIALVGYAAAKISIEADIEASKDSHDYNDFDRGAQAVLNEHVA